ncbi:MAG TPA: AMP-binding protein [Geodermatophilus sp.]|nr:AMP-binding protein [Geodermatophilus sp.]
MSLYDDRPWLALYDEGVPADLEAPFPDCVSMFDAAVRAHPDKPLVHYFGTTLTVADVDRQSAALAAAMAEQCGLRRGDRVVVQLQNVPTFLIAMLAIWRLGAIVVPVNPMYKQRELAGLLTDSGARLLIEQESLYPQAGGPAAESAGVTSVITTSELDYVADPGSESLFAGVQRQRAEGTLDLLDLVRRYDGQRPPPAELGPDDVAFLVYTSGTTGPPKGAMNTHRNVVYNAEVYRQWVHLTGDDVCLAVAPLFHVTGLVAHLGVALLLPMPLVLGYRFEAAVMAELAERHRATWAMGSITAFIALMNNADAVKRDLSAMTKVGSGGAPIAPSTVEQFQEHFGAYIHNIYGLTETTSPSHGVPWGRQAPVDPTSGALSVGVPVCGYTVRIVGEDGEELPPGEVGEVVTEGPGVVPGYWNKPDETAKALPGGRLHTGDVGFMDSEGWFYLVDRQKDMIVASGFKVWPREVEDVLYQHAAVRECGVVGVPDPYRGETVKAFVSLKPGKSAEPAELIAFCKERMAAYKYPRQVEIVDEIPKTVTGKVLRRELRDQATAQAPSSSS